MSKKLRRLRLTFLISNVVFELARIVFEVVRLEPRAWSVEEDRMNLFSTFLQFGDPEIPSSM